jgi:polyphosphate kinase 2
MPTSVPTDHPEARMAHASDDALTLDDMEERAPYDRRPKTKAYEDELRKLQVELIKVQQWVKDAGARVVILFEGRDAAGKGGTIKRFTEHLNPRGTRVVALTKPNETERGQWYFQRYVVQLPTAGEIVLFDRSWYNRAGVERVMGFCTPQEYGEFFRQVPEFERHLVDSETYLFKLWFAVSREEQRRRFDARQDDPLRHWKFTDIDRAAIDRFDEYTHARNAMLVHTDSRDAPWTIVNSNEKRQARLEAIRHVTYMLPYPAKDDSVAHAPDPRVVRAASEVLADTD